MHPWRSASAEVPCVLSINVSVCVCKTLPLWHAPQFSDTSGLDECAGVDTGSIAVKMAMLTIPSVTQIMISCFTEYGSLQLCTEVDPLDKFQ